MKKLKKKDVRKFVLAAAIYLFLFVTTAYQVKCQGIKFSNEASWNAVLAKAKAENKYIFVDCYATWCVPCRYMDKTVFIKKEAGDFYNERFINVRIQMDQTPKDVLAVKNWYPDAAKIKKQYEVGAYPTYLFFSPDGKLVHRASGSEEVQKFISWGKQALDPTKQYYTMLTDLDKVNGDSLAMGKLAKTALAIHDYTNFAKITQVYLKLKHNLLNQDDITIIQHYVGTVNSSLYSPEIQFLIKNAPRIDEIMKDPHFVERRTIATIYESEFKTLFIDSSSPIYFQSINQLICQKYQLLNNKFLSESIKYLFRTTVHQKIKTLAMKQNSTYLDWTKIADTLKIIFPNYPELNRVFLENKVIYCEKMKQWTECADAADKLLTNYGEQFSDNDINNFVWYDIFLHSNDPRILSGALKHQKRVVEKQTTDHSALYSNWLDTFANLLYKTGSKREAILWENKAIATARQENKPDALKEYQGNLRKIISGAPTWE